MKAIRPPKTPRGLAFTPAYSLPASSTVTPLGLFTPERDGVVNWSIAQQTVDCLANVEDALAALGPDARAVKMTLLMTDVREVWTSNAEFDRHYADGGRQNPAKTLLEVPACSVPGARFELDVWAVHGSGAGAVASLDAVSILSGEPGAMAGAGIEDELDACLSVIDQALSRSGQHRSDVAKLSVHIADMAVWPRIRTLLENELRTAPTVVVPMAVSKVGRVGARLEMTAWVSGPVVPVTPGTPGVLAISGSAAIPMYVGGEAADIYRYQPVADIRAQTEVCLRNYAAILETAGATWDDIVETTWHLSDRREWDCVADVARSWFGRPVPNPTVVEVPKFVLPGVRIEIDMWGTIPAAAR